MNTKKNVKKIQISIPVEDYPKVESLWLGLGFSSVAEAAKFLLMNNVADFYKQVSKSQKAITKLQKLKATSKNLDSAVAPVQPADNRISKTPSAAKPTSGYIEKNTFEYKRMISDWQKHNPNFVEPLDIKGIRWWIDETTGRKKMSWWKNGGK